MRSELRLPTSECMPDSCLGWYDTRHHCPARSMIADTLMDAAPRPWPGRGPRECDPGRAGAPGNAPAKAWREKEGSLLPVPEGSVRGVPAPWGQSAGRRRERV